jgi:molybdate transport system substrate-binding protein
MMRLAIATALCALVVAGCGGSSGSAAGTNASGGTLNVFAASSLKDAFTQLGKTYEAAHPGWKVRFEFLGSDDLAAQIEQGAPADVYAAASTKYPEQLQAKNLLGKTFDFATNTLVLVVPPGNPAGIGSVQDLANGAKLVVGDPSAPIGSYTETVLGNLGIDPAGLNVVSREQKVTDIVTKVELGEADAGFVYTSDLTAAGSKLEGIPLPASAEATAIYPTGIVAGSKNAEAAQQWIDLVAGPGGQKVLTGDGFGPAPSS